ncbi:Methyltransferase domain-containing protein [Streptomyces sp. WMMB 714]|uniref:class I SAM-dependent methyltransferase n=1 Tax=Streptomyces sp. WMMB 714 TaxID=1286822 RepID=UPI0005F792CB|nr:methyltransferase domain-containing protein [Streptomyces sp. WMMB 714]SCK24620.1 Methyltransferase domain-containing protein [Streptomyces sp. WMMB 714]
MTYQDPLAYLLGLEGTALLRAFTGEYGREFTDARIREIRRLLDEETLADAAVDVAPVNTVDGYAIWSRTYDGPNSAFDIDEPVVSEILDRLPAGIALDAACGTGRMSALLSERGHRTVGVDSSPDMLARARERVPGAGFHLGDLRRLPVAGGVVDLVVCSLALTHVRELAPVMAEFARVLRPGGHLVTSDIHPERVARGSIPSVRTADGKPGRLETHRHLVGDYLRAALAAGLRVRRCEEPGGSGSAERAAPQASPPGPALEPGPTLEPGPWEDWPWTLMDLLPDATAAADAGVPTEIIWHFQLGGP